MAKIADIEGIGATYAKRLGAAGITTTDKLLGQCKSPKARKQLADSTGISEKLVLEWTNRADLFRIKGVAEQYADLLEAAGVDTVPELGKRKSANLHAQLNEVNAKKKLTRQVPSEKQVADWIAQAKKLPRVIQY
jgi:predicted flap endonuclease-1-like 5' DNA nuclease